MASMRLALQPFMRPWMDEYFVRDPAGFYNLMLRLAREVMAAQGFDPSLGVPPTDEQANTMCEALMAALDRQLH